jgi:NAD-dependent dihydropyrimidine dehydrogenase PreA subunit
MSNAEHIHKLAERSGKADSPAMHKILELAMTDDEARFILDLPASNADLAAKYDMDERAVEAKILDLARRGLVVFSRKGIRYPRDPATLHDNILASAPQYIPPEMDKRWMDLYDGEGWANEIGNALAGFGITALRTIPFPESLPPNTKLLPYESIPEIIEANKDLISVRNCCCRTGAKKCDHPTDVCMQFGRRAKYDLYRDSGRKVSADEAKSIALKAGDAGLIPTVTNMSRMEALEFICFCCGCCCLVIDPARRVGVVDKILAPSRFLSKVDYAKCDGCEKCPMRCRVDAIEMKEVPGFEGKKAVVDTDKCLGCGACVPRCPIAGAMWMDLIKPPEFIPETIFGPSSVLHM